MNFDLFKQALTTIITTIQNTATASVVTLKKHTFKVHVDNQVKKVDVKGTVIVSNQLKVESKLKDLKQAVIKLTTTTDSLNKKQYEVKVLNQPQDIAISNFEEVNGKLVGISGEIKGMDKSVQALHKPLEALKTITVSNQPTDELEDITKTLEKLIKSVDKLKLDPTIQVQPTPISPVVIPAPQVTVDTEKIDYDKLSKIFTVPEIDYARLADVLSKKLSSLVITGGGGGGGKFAFVNTNGERGQALTDTTGRVLLGETDKTSQYNISDKDTVDTTKYYGFTNEVGAWYIMEEDTVSETYRYTKGSDSYLAAWANRDSLSYGYYYDIF